MNPNNLVAEMLALTQGQTAAMTAGQQQLQQTSNQIGGIGAQIQTAGQEYIAQAGVAAERQAAADYATRTVHQQAQRAAGLDPDAVENEITRSLASVTAAQSEREQLAGEWQSLQQADFISNPIGYIVNQFKANDVARRHNAAQQIEQSGYANIQNRTAALQQIKSSVSANTADTLNEAATAKAKAETAASQMKLYEAEQGTLSKQAGLWMQGLDLELKKSGAAKDFVKFRQDTQQYAAAQQERAENRALIAEQRAMLRADKKAKEQADAEFRNRLTAVSDFIGRPGEFTPETLKMMGDKKLATKVITAADTLTLGNNLAEGVALVAQAGNLDRVKASNAGVHKLVYGAATSIKSRTDQLAAKVDPKTGKAPKREDAQKLAAEAYQDELEQSVGSPKAAKPINSPLWANEFNPYAAQHDVIADEVSSGKLSRLANNVVAKTVSNLLVSKTEPGPLKPQDETLIFKSIAEQVASGTLDSGAAAAQMKQYYDTAAAKSLQMYQYDRFNLPVPANYFVQVPLPAGLSAAGGLAPFRAFIPGEPTQQAAVDLRNVASIERVLKTYAVAANRGAATEAMFGNATSAVADFLRGYPLK